MFKMEGIAPSFGKESPQQLVKFFSNCVYLGQWEFAAACVDQLLSIQDDHAELDVCRELLSIARNPYNVGLGSDGLFSPHHLSRLCLQKMMLRGDCKQTEDLKKLKRDVEFRLLLYAARTTLKLDESVLQELFNYHQHRLYSDADDAAFAGLSSICRADLSNILYEHTSLGHAILDSLSPYSQKQPPNTIVIAPHLHLKALSKILDEIRAMAGSAHREDALTVSCNQFYALLCTYFSNLCMPSQWEELDSFFKCLIQTLNTTDSPLSRSTVYSAMLHSKAVPFVKRFLQIEYEMGKQRLCAAGQSLQMSSVLLEDEELVLLGLVEMDDKQKAWNGVFSLCQNSGRHFFDIILDACMHLLQSNNLHSIETLLEPEEFQPLRPLILLICWDCCANIETASSLLKVLHGRTDVDDTAGLSAALSKAVRQLSAQLDLVQYSLNWTHQALAALGHSLPLSAMNLFKASDVHSALYFLHCCIPLHTLPCQEVLSFLFSAPHSSHSDDHSSQCKKSVKFLLDGEDQPSDLNVGLERDLSLYRSYFAIKCFMDAVAFCADQDAWNLLQESKARKVSAASAHNECISQRPSTVSISSTSLRSFGMTQFRKIRSFTNQSLISLESASVQQDATNCLESLQELYDQGVTTSLNEAKEHLQKIYPLVYRMEILENLFSLLFATHEDVQQLISPGSHCLDSDDDIDAALHEGIDARHRRITSSDADKSCHTQLSRKSESWSAHSNTSVGENHKIGFIVNEFAVRDVLHMLKEILVKFTAEVYSIQKNVVGDDSAGHRKLLDEQLTQCMGTSLRPEVLQSRLNKLTQLVSEALWRFQLVASESVPKTLGQVPCDVNLLSDEDSDDKDMDDAGGVTRKRTRRLSRRRISSSSGKETGRESESHSLPTDGDYSSGPSLSRRIKKKKRLKKPRRSSLSILREQRGVISQMLATPETLLNMSLQKGKFAQAEQVKKMYSIEGSLNASEVMFAEQFASAVRKLQAQDSQQTQVAVAKARSDTLKQPTKSLGVLSKPSLNTIANKAALGISSMSVSSVVDQLLSLSSLPSFPAVAAPDLPESVCIAKHINHANVPAMIVLDLACVAPKTYNSSSTLLEMAKRRLDDSEQIQKSQSRSRRTSSSKQATPATTPQLPGIHGFTKKMYGSFWENISKYAESDENYPRLMNRSLCTALTTVTSPLDSELLKIYSSAVAMLDKELKRGVSAMQLVDKESRQDENKAGVVRSKKPVMRMTVKALIEGCRRYLPPQGLQHIMINYANLSDDSMEKVEYLRVLYDYVRTLAHFVVTCKGTESDSGHVEYFSILQESPTRILGKLIFIDEVPPKDLVDLASRLHVDLSHVIIDNCCPKIPFNPCPKFLPPSDFQKVDQVTILNCGSNLAPRTTPDPEKLVRHILTNLVKLMQDAAQITNSNGMCDIQAAYYLLESDQHLPLLEMTQFLRNVDLSLLKTDMDRISFFGNLTNLLTIHALLHQIGQIMLLEESWAQNGTKSSCPQTYGIQPSCLMAALYTKASALNDVLWQKSVAYEISQLGTVSLFDLKHVILKHGLKPSTSYGGLIVHRHLQLDDNDPWFKFCPLSNSHMIFILADGSLSSPCLRVLSPELAQLQLVQAFTDFLTSAVKVNKARKTVHVHRLLHDHQRDFISPMCAASTCCCPEDKIQQSAQREALFQFMLSFAEGELADDLREVLQAPPNPYGRSTSPSHEVELIVDEVNLTFGYFFNMDAWHKHQQQPRRPSVDINSLSFHSTAPDSRKPLPSIPCPKHFLNAATLDFLKSDSELIATLTSLVAETSTDASAVNQYKFRKMLTEFPALQHYILTDFSQLAPYHVPGFSEKATRLEQLCNANLPTEFRSILFACMHSPHFQQFILALAEDLIHKHAWSAMLDLLNSIPWTSFNQSDLWFHLRDHIICCAVDSEPFLSETCGVYIPSLIAQISDLALRQRLVLANLKHWDVKHAIMLLRFCLREGQQEKDDLTKLVNLKLRHMRVFQQITECARGLLLHLSTSGRPQAAPASEGDDPDWPYHFLERLCSWQEIVRASQEDPMEVLTTLLQCNEYEVAQQWGEIFSVNPELKQMMAESQCMWYLERDAAEPDLTKASQLLEDMLSSVGVESCIAVCENLLEKLSICENVLFIAEFMASSLEHDLSPVKKQHLVKVSIGCKALLRLPKKAHADYSHLVSSPYLLLEQLLMNMKVEWSGLVLVSIRHDLKALDPSEHSALGLTDDSLNALITTYAQKALDFWEFQAEDSRSHPRSLSRMSFASVGSQLSALGTSRYEASRRLQIHRSDTVAAFPSVGAISGRSIHSRRGQEAAAFSSTPSSQSTFVMPAEPPSKDQWVPDSEASVCMVCNVERFTMFTRRHHCRRCGRVVCANCSTHTTVIRGSSARTCDDCYQQIYKPKSEETDKVSMLKERLSGIGSYGHSPVPISRSPEGIQITVGSVESDGPGMDYTSSSHSNADCQFKLLPSDEEYNRVTREEFCYDYAPSTSLCLSILELHNNLSQCANVILDLCESVSHFLRPVSPGLVSTEVDYGFIISMLQYMLLHAKIKFMTAGNNRGVGRCEVYSSHIQLLQSLITSGCSWIPSIESMSKPDTLRRLRDRLIEQELYSVAMEISTKCGLDPSGVWMAWGLVCLKAGDFTLAKSKFEKCLKAPNDKHQLGQKQITDIVECLENTPLIQPDAPLKSLSDCTLDEPHLQEVVYYLHHYGSHAQCVSFYQRHGALNKAVHYILDRKVRSDVFIESLVQPCLCQGEFSKLCECLLSTDPSLEKWNSHLMACCNFLNKTSKMNTLYSVQLFMKDFIRAGMMCTNHFFTSGATSYVDLHARLHHLSKGREHFESYTDERQWGQVPHPKWTHRQGTPEIRVRLTMKPPDITKYIHTIDLQIEVTKFLYRYHDNYVKLLAQQQQQQSQASAGSKTCKVPLVTGKDRDISTLFISTKMKHELVFLILVCGNNVHDGYGLAFRLIQDLKLDANSIYCQVGRHFAQCHKYNLISQLLQNVKDSGLYTDQGIDEIIMGCLEMIASEVSESKEAENLIRMVRGDTNKINAYIACGKLRSAFLAAARAGRPDDVQRIMSIAEQSNQLPIKEICKRYFEKKELVDD